MAKQGQAGRESAGAEDPYEGQQERAPCRKLYQEREDPIYEEAKEKRCLLQPAFFLLLNAKQPFMIILMTSAIQYYWEENPCDMKEGKPSSREYTEV